MKRICCFALALGLPLGALGAQDTPGLAAGARIRVIARQAGCYYPEAAICDRTVVGSLESIDSATIVVRRENGETANLSRAPGTRLDVSAGGRVCGGCIVGGFFGGAAVGAVVGVIAAGDQTYHQCCPPGVVTVPAGAVLGMVVGALVRVERWKSTPIPAHLSVAPDGSGRRLLGLSVRF